MPNDNQKTLQPKSSSEVADAVRAAVADSTKLRTARRECGEVVPDGICLLDLQQMSSVVDYPARDMTITVQAGIRCSELGRSLTEENQQLPVDCFDPAMSVGAMVAADTTGPRQFGYGTLRDYVIGIEAVDGQGRVFHAGGRVVKNVAGYDLCRLMVGSRGSLGVLTQVTFKLKPLPEQSLLNGFHFPDISSFAAALERINVSAANPVVLDFTAVPQSDDDGRGPLTLSVGVEGAEPSCDWQMQQIRNECGTSATLTFDSRDTSYRKHGVPEFRIPEHCRRFGYGWMAEHYRIATFPSKIAAMTNAVTEAGYTAVGHAGNGILYAVTQIGKALPVDGESVLGHHSDGTQDVAKHDPKLLELCEQLVAEHGGSVSTWESSHPAHNTDPLSLRLRKAFDPHGVFC